MSRYNADAYKYRVVRSEKKRFFFPSRRAISFHPRHHPIVAATLYKLRIPILSIFLQLFNNVSINF